MLSSHLSLGPQSNRYFKSNSSTEQSFPNKLTVFHLVQKFTAFYGTRRFIPWRYRLWRTLGRLSSRRWQSFPTAQDGTGFDMWSAHRIPQLHFQLSKPDRYFFIQAYFAYLIIYIEHTSETESEHNGTYAWFWTICLSRCGVYTTRKAFQLPPCRRQVEEELQLLFILDLGTRWGWMVSKNHTPAVNYIQEWTPGAH
jgi:hypothetical protein